MRFFPERVRWPGPRTDPPAPTQRDCARERSLGRRNREHGSELRRCQINSPHQRLRASSGKRVSPYRCANESTKRSSKMNNPMKSIRFARGTFLSLFIAVLLLTSRAGSAQNEGHRIRNIVLVHGAWVDGSGWKGVYDILVKDGYSVSIVQEPETSFKDDG